MVPDRVRENTAPDVNARIDQRVERNVRCYAHADEEMIRQRIRELDEEWDVERLLETNASSLLLAGALFSLVGGRKWLLLSLTVSGFLLQHALQGWCPPIEVLRRIGIRTRKEIDQEKYALKALRGDFRDIGDRDGGRALEAARAT